MTRSNSREEGLLFSLQFEEIQSVIVGKISQQQEEVADHTRVTSRNRKWTGSELSFRPSKPALL